MSGSNLRIKVLIFFIIVSGLTHAEELKISGYARTQAGVILKSHLNYAILQNTFSLGFEKEGKRAAIYANPFLNLDLDQKKPEFGLRQLYIDIFFKAFDSRIGKQQIIWGNANSVFITDVVSPKDMSYFLLPDFDEIRIGVTAVKSDIYIKNSTVEMIWIPVFTPNINPESNSIWYRAPVFPVPAVISYNPPSKIPSLKNSDHFLKYSLISSVLDFDLMGGYTFDDEPSWHIKKNINTATRRVESLDIELIHHRLPVAGLSFSTDLQGLFLLRGEGAYYFGKYFLPKDLAYNGLIRRDYLQYLVGLEKSLLEINFNLQFIQKIIVRHTEQMKEEKIDNSMTLLINRKFIRDTLLLEVLVHSALEKIDMMIKPKIEYAVLDALSVQLGGNIFIGGQNGKFGRYNENDMIFTRIKYSF